MIENPKKTRRNSHLAIFASLMLSATSAYCTVSGVHSLFVGGGLMIALIASCIEASRVSTVFLIHHYWNKLKWFIKSVGCLFILIACLFSAWGVYGYLSSAYGTQLDNVAPLSLQIQAKQDEIQIQQDIIDGNNQQIEGIKSSSTTQNKLFEKQLSGDTSGLTQEELAKIQKQQNRAIGNSEYYQTQINRLYNKNRTASDNIVKLKKEIAQLKADSIKAAPELQRMKGLASLFGITDDNILITLVIILIMCIFDPLSMYLMILGDNIGKMADDIEVDAIEKNDDIKKSLLEKIILKNPFKKFKKESKKEKIETVQAVANAEVKSAEEKVEESKSEIQVLSKDASKKLAERLLEEPKSNDALKEAMKDYEKIDKEEPKEEKVEVESIKEKPKRKSTPRKDKQKDNALTQKIDVLKEELSKVTNEKIKKLDMITEPSFTLYKKNVEHGYELKEQEYKNKIKELENQLQEQSKNIANEVIKEINNLSNKPSENVIDNIDVKKIASLSQKDRELDKTFATLVQYVKNNPNVMKDEAFLEKLKKHIGLKEAIEKSLKGE